MFKLSFGMQLLVLPVCAALLAGCSAVENFASQQATPPASAQASSPAASVLPARQCPGVIIREGEAVRTVYARGQENNPRAVIYQAVISETARECASFGSTFEFRLGVKGKVTAGAAAQPGQGITLNVLMTYQDGENVLWRSVRQIPVTLDPSQGSVEFSFIEENGSALLPDGTDEFAFDITVGFAPEGRTR